MPSSDPTDPIARSIPDSITIITDGVDRPDVIRPINEPAPLGVTSPLDELYESDTLEQPEPDPVIVASLARFLSAPERPPGTLCYPALRGFLFAVLNAPRQESQRPWIYRVLGENGREDLLEMEDSMRRKLLAHLRVVQLDIFNLSVDEKLSPRHLLGRDAPPNALREWASGFLVGTEWVSESWTEILDLLGGENPSPLLNSQMNFLYLADPDEFHARWQTSAFERRRWDASENRFLSLGASSYLSFSIMLSDLLAGYEAEEIDLMYLDDDIDDDLDGDDPFGDDPDNDIRPDGPECSRLENDDDSAKEPEDDELEVLDEEMLDTAAPETYFEDHAWQARGSTTRRRDV